MGSLLVASAYNPLQASISCTISRSFCSFQYPCGNAFTDRYNATRLFTEFPGATIEKLAMMFSTCWATCSAAILLQEMVTPSSRSSLGRSPFHNANDSVEAPRCLATPNPWLLC